jgi:hypothetical protein
MSEGDPHDFSVLLDGPLYRLYLRSHLCRDETLDFVGRRAVAITAIAWVPLLILSLVEGHGLRGTALPFLFDADVHARLLVALPLLVATEVWTHTRIRSAVGAFIDRGLAQGEAEARFREAVKEAWRLRSSRSAEILLVLFVYSVGIGVMWRELNAAHVDTWYRQSQGEQPHVTLAGAWYLLVSLPLFQFLIFRWYFRLGIWARFLWRISRVGLTLIPTHPDRAAGLGFLDTAAYAMVPLLFAHGALFSGVVALAILVDGRTLEDYLLPLVFAVALVLTVALGPMAVFTPVLVRARRVGLRDYGALAQEYVRAFDGKWLRHQTVTEAPLLGSSDIQSLADLANSYEVIVGMRFVPITRITAVRLVIATAAPLAPLALTIVSAQKAVGILLKGIF